MENVAASRRHRVDSDSSDEEGQARPEGGLDATSPSSTDTSSAPKVKGVSRDEDSEEDSEGPEDEVEDEVEEDKCQTHNHKLVVNGHQEDEEDEDIKDEEEEKKAADSSDTEEEEEEHEREEEEDEEEVEKELSSKVDAVHVQSPPPAAARSPSPAEEEQRSRSPSPAEEEERSRSPSPAAERKSSQGSSSYDERASSMSPEPAQVISTPNSSLTANNKDITKIYTEALVNEKPAAALLPTEKMRAKPTGDITQIYTASLAKEQQSPKLERARGGKPVKDITQLYTAAFSKPAVNDMPSPNRPRRNDNITKLYTGGFDSNGSGSGGLKSKPSDEITNPRKHNMATSLDREAIREAYNSVMSDNNGVEWAAFKFNEQNELVVSGTGEEFSGFKSHFGPEERGFGYIKIQTGDEMSKRSRFVLVTWVGHGVSVMKKAKMSTDKLLVKEIVQNLSVELQLESVHELNLDHLKAEVDKAGGARYGTGVRDK